MIHQITSSLPSFKTLTFSPGLNVLLAHKEHGASDRQTRNRAGKTSLVEIVHYLLGAMANKESLFRAPALRGRTFEMSLDLGADSFVVSRTARDKAKPVVKAPESEPETLANTQWNEILGRRLFELGSVGVAAQGRKPTFRSLFAYFARREQSGGFTAPEKQAGMQQLVDIQVSLLYLLGLDWQIAADWQLVRDREKTLKELKKAAKEGAFGAVLGKSADLRTELTVKEGRLKALQERIAAFRVHPEYRALELEADQITRNLNELANDNTLDHAAVRDMEAALAVEAPPAILDLAAVYAQAGVVLPGVALQQYDDVRRFHESVIRNRKDYLLGELEEARQRISARDHQKGVLDARRSELLALLNSHGALEQFSKLQAEGTRLDAEVNHLRQRYESALQIEGSKNELDFERSRLSLRLKRDFVEQEARLQEAILVYENISKSLYESAGSMQVDTGSNGPGFSFPIQGARSKGIKNMKIFCFDMMLMCLCGARGIGPGFLIHDSHLFDGVDGRQVISALKVGARLAEEHQFQYIVTMNEDDAFKETLPGFDLSDYVMDVKLTDASEDGGLFGIRF
ncbi:ABC-three component system protein [Acanthopleuribacter pedis]|uniref:DUF2326 domain-containing protein n=1 Tax=Acanthopleuribacter pedis TaxID=442870 RepID=A0A8J7Q5J9_9BACT|nr:ABC-three component system protein [Acanthopleuribacter pedis]MBO1319500.1 DUF2326 domain-containing protein [Acanthopleuribacter pedis]